ncbi:C1 family peptidase [Nostoc sp. FACHB-110]|uniref:C1 family peptidase n=1 Tax=Nostoc sp. FACHB-110 TaxID=2692834 RepID=UPI001684B755|nr:C1 family peptidase [Nostoc sp. FACHB-110]MBD2438105.1 cysteine protease [Nostoc sp. FACHB-110]
MDVKNYRMGWLPDSPDFRDFSIEKIYTNDNSQHICIPKSIDLRQWFAPIKEQGEIKACTAIAGVALVEYFERKLMEEDADFSSLFLYKVTRNLMRLTGDTGASLRSTMKAMALFGLIPEEYWPYKIEAFDAEPSSFCYAYAQNYQARNYFRLDLPQLSKPDLLINIKACLASELPAMFGFSTYSSILDQKVIKTGEIPYPRQGEKTLGGHAVVAVGYDDCKQALLIRNCWGKDWGDDGYGWLPYDYVLNGLAIDWWSLLKTEWFEAWQFKLDPSRELNEERFGADPKHKKSQTIKIPIVNTKSNTP